jgi:hypothetical protein
MKKLGVLQIGLQLDFKDTMVIFSLGYFYKISAISWVATLAHQNYICKHVL